MSSFYSALAGSLGSMHPLLYIALGLIVVHLGTTFAVNTIKRRLSQQKIIKEHGCKAPRRERPWDVLGLLKMWTHTRNLMKHTTIPSSIESFKKYGETFEFKILGARFIMTCEPRNIRHLQVDAFEDFNTAEGLRDHMFVPLVSHSLVCVDGEAWKHERPVYRDLLSSTKTIFNERLHESTFQALKSCIPTDGTEIELQELVRKFMYDFSAQWLMGESGRSLQGQDEPERAEFLDNLGEAIHMLAGTAHRPWLIPFTDKKKLKTAIDFVHRGIDRAVDKTLELRKTQDPIEEGAAPQTLLEAMLEFTTDRAVLRNTTLTLLIVATDPVVSVLSSTMWVLARNPDMYRKVREEVIGIAGEEPPSYDDVRRMTYLRNVFNEVLRLYVPVPQNGKAARKDTWLPVGGGPDGESSILVRKGDFVLYSPWSSHRRTGVFGEDAEEFRPERWESLKGSNIAGYVPFNLGPRACPGQHFALAQTQWIAARLAQTYPAISTTDTRGWVEQLDDSFNAKNRNGVIVSFTE